MFKLAKAYEKRGGKKDKKRAIVTYKRIYDAFGRGKDGRRAKEELDRFLGVGWEQNLR